MTSDTLLHIVIAIRNIYVHTFHIYTVNPPSPQIEHSPISIAHLDIITP